MRLFNPDQSAMKTRLRPTQIAWIFKLASLLLTSTLLIASIQPSWAMAQSAGDPWSTPMNLSHSGVAKDPSFVVDSTGVGHVVWRDDAGHYVYTQFDGTQWSTPEMTSLDHLFRLPIAGESAGPAQTALYTGPNPLLIAGSGQYVFAFWISPQGILFTSKVKNQNFGDLLAWDTRYVITLEAASFAAAIDARGTLHLAYVQTVDEAGSPAGVYYTRSKSSGLTWSTPVLLYESPYFRRLSVGEGNISVATTEADDAVHVSVAWDNRPRKQVFLAQSSDGGANWGQPALIAGPASASGLADPFNIHVGSDENGLVLVWQSGRPGGVCNQIYQSSADEGASWSDPQFMFEGLSGCAQANEFVAGVVNNKQDPLYLLTETQSQTYLSAWNGHQWSLPQAQPLLSGFEEPEIYTGVEYGCHRADLLGTRMYVVGCDQGGGGDIWVTSRDVGSNSSWFQPQTWSPVSPVTVDGLEMEALALSSTDDGHIHAFFSKHQDPAIYYAYWNGDAWSRTITAMELPDGEVGWPAIAAGSENELFLIAQNNRGTLYFSRATSGKVTRANDWSTPVRLGFAQNGQVGSADVASDAAGTLYVAYSLPINEQRGIYLFQSKDEGETWSEPVQVFDGASAGFELVGAPSLQVAPTGVLHVVWKEQSIEGDGVSKPRSLFYSRSEDGGHTFTKAEMIVDEPVAWRDIVTDGKGNLHLLWQPQDSLATVWDQVSSDGGQTWQYPEGLPDEGKLATVTTDRDGRVHLLGVGSGSLDHWLWDGGRWQSETSMDLPWSSQQENTVEWMAATINKQGKMLVVFSQPAGEGDGGEVNLLSSTRLVELSQKQTATKVPPTPTVVPLTMTPLPSTPESLAIPTNVEANSQVTPESPIDQSQGDDPGSPLVMALVPVALLLLGVLGIGIRQAARLKDL